MKHSQTRKVNNCTDNNDCELSDARRLCDLCECIYASFNSSGGVTLDTHLETQLQELTTTDENIFISQVGGADMNFAAVPGCAVHLCAGSTSLVVLLQVVYGLLRYRKFLSSFLESFFHHNRCSEMKNAASRCSTQHCCTQPAGGISLLDQQMLPAACHAFITTTAMALLYWPSTAPV